MKTLKKVEINLEKVRYIPNVSEMNEKVIYISDEFGTSSHKCMCGCGELTVLPIGEKEWNYQIDGSNRISMQPSVSNYQLPCKSHYIIKKGVANLV